MSTTAAPPALLPAVAALRRDVDAKAALMAAQNARLETLKHDLADAAIAGQPTAAIREQVKAAEEKLWDLGTAHTHAAGLLEAAEQADDPGGREAMRLLAALYRDDVEFLKRNAEVHRLHGELEAARARLAECPTTIERDSARRRIIGAWLGLSKVGFEHVARVYTDGGIAIEDRAGTSNNGGATLDEVQADIKRFERLAAEAEEAANHDH